MTAPSPGAQRLQPPAPRSARGGRAVLVPFDRPRRRYDAGRSRDLKSITEAKAKTDQLDARTLTRLLASGLLDQVWTPDERTRTLRRLTNRRERLVRARTRAKNEAHGVLARNLCQHPPVTTRSGGEADAGWRSSSCCSTSD